MFQWCKSVFGTSVQLVFFIGDQTTHTAVTIDRRVAKFYLIETAGVQRVKFENKRIYARYSLCAIVLPRT